MQTVQKSNALYLIQTLGISMADFNLLEKIINNGEILELDGNTTNFHFDESHVISLTYKRGNYIQDPGYFENPTIDASIEFSYDKPPFIVDLQFRLCESVVLNYFDSENIINRLSISIEKRGFFADNITPLPPFICVEIDSFEYRFCEKTGLTIEHTVAFTSFKCFEIEILGKREITGASYA